MEKTEPAPPVAASPMPAEKPREKPAATPAPATPAPVAKAEVKPAAGTKGEARAAEKKETKSIPVPVPKAPEGGASPAVITSTVPPAPAQIVRGFFASLEKRDIDGAYENLMKGSKIAERPDEVRTLKAKTREAISLFGSVHGYDLVESKPVGERLMRATYLSLGQDFPLRCRFYFYKPEDEWQLIDLRVDDKLTGIFDESPEEAVPRANEPRP